MIARCPFDHHSPEHAVDPVGVYRALRNGPGIESSDRHGGFSVLSRYDDIADVARRHDEFSSALILEGDDHLGGGVTLPHNPAAPRMSLSEMEPPEWRPLRRLLNPLFSPEAIRRLSPDIRTITTSCIDRFIESGSCDLVFDLCSPVPAIVTLRLAGLPTDDWEKWSVPIHTSVYTPRRPGHPAWEALLPNLEWIFSQIRQEIADRHRERRDDDLISTLMYSPEPIDDDLIFETVYTILAAGVDTTTSLLSSALWHLSQHDDDRRRLIANPELLEPATEEFLRFYSPAQALARTAVSEVDVAGRTFHRGDRLLLAWASANRDPVRFDDPDSFVLDRPANRHLSFGMGIHRCIGAPLARLESVIVLGEVLRRLPDFKVDLSATAKYPDIGLMFGFQTMPANFSPQTVSPGPPTIQL